MKNKKINIKTITIIVLIGIVVSLILINLNYRNTNIEKQEETSKEQLVETAEDNAYVSMQAHLSEINEEEQKLLSFKTAIASAITEMGVTTSQEDGADTMASNIKSISTKKTLNLSFSSGIFGGYTNSYITWNGKKYGGKNAEFNVSDLDEIVFGLNIPSPSGCDRMYVYGDKTLLYEVNSTVVSENTWTIDVSEYSTITVLSKYAPATTNGTAKITLYSIK